MAELSIEPTFTKFPSLPVEIRYMIWEAAIPGPRIVTIRQRALDKTLGEWIEDEGFHNGLFPGESADDVLLGITSDCKPMQILFVCRESYHITSKIYQQTFATETAFAETYFDFKRDTLYLRYDTLKDLTPPYVEADRDFDDLPYSLIGITDLEKVTNLAILVDPEAIKSAINDWYDSTTNITEWVAQILRCFDAFWDHDDQSTLLLMDPINLDVGFHQFAVHTADCDGCYPFAPRISNLHYTKVDEKLLQSHLTHLTRESKSPQSAPVIDYQICLPEKGKEEYEDAEKNCRLECEYRRDNESERLVSFWELAEQDIKKSAREAKEFRAEAQESNAAVHFTEGDFSDDDHIQTAIELNDSDFSDDDHILASI
ncbi:hypothetical protein LARI1_G007561 [Lachnellula arida]|uniref:2EXR domain-containing protein n=1 Tax=Lachnellula arida TaxID=1316785 RepID=A0A8T9BDL9_9HELO|nr:hypothetical protein LARI1_G007561 [Lachnellula arida]